GRRGMDAELVLEADAPHVVPRTGRAVVVDMVLGHEEQRYAAAAVGRAGQACEDEMNDVLGQIVLAEGDEDLLPGDPVLAGVLSVLDRRRGRAQRAEVAARLWLGEV